MNYEDQKQQITAKEKELRDKKDELGTGADTKDMRDEIDTSLEELKSLKEDLLVNATDNFIKNTLSPALDAVEELLTKIDNALAPEEPDDD